MDSLLDEKDFRKKAKDIFAHIENGFDGIDPDVVECENGLGTLIFLAKGKKIILSTQPPVRQIWLANASQGVAVHFSWDAQKNLWLDDKGQGFELMAYLEKALSAFSGQSIRLAAL